MATTPTRHRLIPALLLLLGFIMLAAPARAADWAESWFENATFSSPGSFDDQTRGEGPPRPDSRP